MSISFKNVSVIIVEKVGILKMLTIKDYKVEDLYKKCNFKKAEGFIVQHTWNTMLNGQKYSIELYAKTDGKSGTENKYEFPSPIDKITFFGSCILVGYLRDDSGEKSLFNLTIPLWTTIYEKLFKGQTNIKEIVDEYNDLEETDSEESVNNNNKNKFAKKEKIVNLESNSDNEEEYESTTESDVNTDDYESKSEENYMEEQEELLDDFGSELSEESYDYSDDEV